jgi:hypothetical protein
MTVASKFNVWPEAALRRLGFELELPLVNNP